MSIKTAVTDRRRVLISEACSWDMEALGFPYLPYVWGVLKTWHEQQSRLAHRWNWLAPIYRYGAPHHLLQGYLDGPIDILGLSCYTWNWKLQCEIAAIVKARHPNCLIVAGGPQPDFSDPEFFSKHPFIDCIAVKDGEITFSKILDAWSEGSSDLSGIRGLYLPNVDAAMGHRFTGDPDVPTEFGPSPYIAQTDQYEQIIRDCEGRYCAIWETNRGCPFRCSFCDWGSNTMSKVRRFPPERVTAELEWMGRNRVPSLFLADANFGMYAEDVELGKRIADTYRKYQCPASFSYNSAKNKPEPTVAISRILFDSGMPYKHTLSIQHTRDEVLEATDRKNISSAKQIAVVRELMEIGIPIEVQLIVGIPGDTYELWKGCFGDLMEWGVHGQYQTYLYHLLPNAPAARPAFRQRWQTGTVDRRVWLSPHLGLVADGHSVIERNEIVVSSSTYDRDDWVRFNVYAAFIKALHTSGLTQLLAHYLRRTHGISYEAFYSGLIDDWASRTPLYQRLVSHFQAFLTDDEAGEFIAVEQIPAYPHPLAPFQWLQVQFCLALDQFFAQLGGYLLATYPEIPNLQSLLHYQKALQILPDYDSREGKRFITDLDWPSYFRLAPSERPLPEPHPGSGGQVRISDTESSDGAMRFPLDWFDCEGEQRWLIWIDRIILNYSCAERATFRDIDLGPVRSDASLASLAARAPATSDAKIASAVTTAGEATAILAKYMTLLAQGVVDGTTVIDAASLPHAKLQILSAATLMSSLNVDAAERESLSTAACALAFFQHGTQRATHRLDERRADGETWGRLVEAEMRHIAATLPTAPADRSSI